MKLSPRFSGLPMGLALAAICIAPALHAATPASEATPATAAPSAFTLNTSTLPSLQNFRYEAVSSSSNDDEAGLPDAPKADNAALDFDQSGRRRSYGRSRYQDRMHNKDGSSRIAFVGGAGLNLPVGNTAKYYTPHVAIVAGAGINFNRTFGILGEFSYQRMGLTSGAINTDYTNTYNALIAEGNSASDVTSFLDGFDANAHIYGISINPIVNLVGKGKVGAYVTGGLGYYHKTTNFTIPSVSEDQFGDVFQENETFDSYSKGGIGYNGGVGLTYKLSEFSSERLFMEARYEWLNFGKNNSDFFPYNARNTETLPITVGIRF